MKTLSDNIQENFASESENQQTFIENHINTGEVDNEDEFVEKEKSSE